MNSGGWYLSENFCQIIISRLCYCWRRFEGKHIRIFWNIWSIEKWNDFWSTFQLCETYLMKREEGCCKLNCFKQLTYVDVKRCRDIYQSKINAEKKSFVLDFFSSQGHYHANVFLVAGTPVCKSAWLFFHGINIRS